MRFRGLEDVLDEENDMCKGLNVVSFAMALKGLHIGEAKRGEKNTLDVGDMRKCFQEWLHHVCRTGTVAGVTRKKKQRLRIGEEKKLDWYNEGRKERYAGSTAVKNVGDEYEEWKRRLGGNNETLTLVPGLMVSQQRRKPEKLGGNKESGFWWGNEFGLRRGESGI